MAGKGGRNPGAGRKKGVPNKRTLEVRATCERLKCDPFELFARITNGELECSVCFGKGKTYYRGDDGLPKLRGCQSCWGTLREKISPGDRLRAATELAQYVLPKLRAIEHTGKDGGPILLSLAESMRKAFEESRAAGNS